MPFWRALQPTPFQHSTPQALCIAPGETAAFEYEFANRSSWPGWFEIDLGDSMHSSSRSRSRSQAAATLSFVSGEGEWQALESTARLAGGRWGGGDS